MLLRSALALLVVAGCLCFRPRHGGVEKQFGRRLGVATVFASVIPGGARAKERPRSPAESEVALEMEKRLRSLVSGCEWEALRLELGALSSCQLASGRNVVFLLTETLRRMERVDMAVPLLSSIMPGKALDCSEDDVMPMLDKYARAPKCTQVSMAPAMKIFSYLSDERKVSFSVKGYSVLLKGYGRAGEEAMVDRIVQQCASTGQTFDTILLNSVLDAYVRCGNPAKAETIFSIVANEPHYSPRPPRKDNAESIAIMFLSSGVLPNTCTFNTLLKALRDSPDPDPGAKSDIGKNTGVTFLEQRGRALLATMTSRGLEPDQVTVNTLIDASAKRSLFDFAESLLEDEGLRDKVGIEGYTSLIVGYAAERSTRRMSRGSENPGARSSSSGDSSGLADPFRIVAHMQNRGILPNEIMCTVVMEWCFAAGALRLARELLAQARSLYEGPGTNATLAFSSGASSSTSPVPARVAFVNSSSSSSISSRNNSFSDALSVVKSFNLGKRLPKTNLAALYEAFVVGVSQRAMAVEKEGQEEWLVQQALLGEAQRRLLEMELLELPQSTRALNVFLQALCSFIGSEGSLCSSSGKASGGYGEDEQPALYQVTPVKPQQTASLALSLVTAMRRDGCRPDCFTHAILFTALGRAGLTVQALELFSSLIDDKDDLGQTRTEAELKVKGKAKSEREKTPSGLSAEVFDTTAANALLRAVAEGEEPVFAVRLFAHLQQLGTVAVIGSDEVASIATSPSAEARYPQVNSSYSLQPDVITFTVLFQAITKAISLSGTQLARTRTEDSRRAGQPVLGLKAASNTGWSETTISDFLATAGANTSRALKNSQDWERPSGDGVSASVPLVTDDTGSGSSGSGAASYNGSGTREGRRCAVALALYRLDLLRPDKQQQPLPLPQQSQPQPQPQSQPQLPPWIKVPVAGESQPDSMVERLFRSMCFDHDVRPDEKLVATLNYLFSVAAEQQQLRQRGVAGVGGGLFGFAGWGGSVEIGSNTARLILEELVISGFDPAAMLPIVRACKYSARKESLVLSDEDGSIARLRASSASSRIFRKYRWNSVASGFF